MKRSLGFSRLVALCSLMIRPARAELNLIVATTDTGKPLLKASEAVELTC